MWIVASVSCLSCCGKHVLPGFMWELRMLFCIPWLLFKLLLLSYHPGAATSQQGIFTGYFIFFRPFSLNPRDGSAGKSQWVSSFWNTQASLSGINNHGSNKVTYITFLHQMLFREGEFIYFIVSLHIWFNKQLSICKVPNQVAGECMWSLVYPEAQMVCFLKHIVIPQLENDP